MSGLKGSLGYLRHRASMFYWANKLKSVETAGPEKLLKIRRRAKAVARVSGKVAQQAEQRLKPATGARSAPILSGRMTWAFRPDIFRQPVRPNGISPVPSGTRISDQVTLHHDGATDCATVRQVQTGHGPALSLDIFDFSGTFFSAAIDLPEAAWAGLSKSELIRLNVETRAHPFAKIYSRINIRHGPNTEQIIREVDLAIHKNTVEFDLHYSGMEPDKVNGMWLDFICESPRMCQIVIDDLVLSRHPRANV